MNRSYSKLRHINNTNYLLEQKYLGDKRRTDLGVLTEQEEDSLFSNLMGPMSDLSANKDYSKFPCVAKLKVAKGNRLRFDSNYYYFPSGKYASIISVNQYNKDVVNNPDIELTYGGTYSCKETVNDVTGIKESTIKLSPFSVDTSNYEFFKGFDTTDTRGPIERVGTPVAQDTSNTETSTQSTTTSGVGGGFGTIYPNVFTSNVINTIRQKIGSSDTSPSLTQDDINKLYDAINK